MSQPKERRAISWRKTVQFVGVLLLANICPFAAILSMPKNRNRNTDETSIEGQLDD